MANSGPGIFFPFRWLPPRLVVSQDDAVANRGDLVILAEQREHARQLLANRYAEGILDLDAYEVRIDTVERAEDLATIRSTVTDLRPEEPDTVRDSTPPTALARRVGSVEVVPRDQVRQSGRVLSIIGSVRRKGTWDVPRELSVTAILADVDLDLREARLAEGVTEIRVISILADVTIIAPPGLRVVMDGKHPVGRVRRCGRRSHRRRRPRGADLGDGGPRRGGTQGADRRRGLVAGVLEATSGSQAQAQARPA